MTLVPEDPLAVVVIVIATMIVVAVEGTVAAVIVTTIVVVEVMMTTIVVAMEVDDVTEMTAMDPATSIVTRADHVTTITPLPLVSDVVVAAEATMVVKSAAAAVAAVAVMIVLTLQHPHATKLHVNMVAAAEVTIVKIVTVADKSTT